jgi:hypothetical protein
MTERRDNFSADDIYCSIMSAIDVDLFTMSIGGVALIANERLKIGSDYTLTLEEKGRVCSVKGTII